MGDFNLQFLNGVGESYDRPYNSYENLEVVQPLQRGAVVMDNGQTMIENSSDAVVYDHQLHCHTSRVGRIILWMVVGAVGGQMLKKLFKD